VLKFHCRCGKKLGVLDDWEGKWVTCPACKNSVRVRRDGGADQPAGSASTAAGETLTPPAPGNMPPVPRTRLPKPSPLLT